MHSTIIKILIGAFALGGCLSGAPARSADSLLVFAGAASKPPTEEAAKRYEQKTGVKVELVFGGSGSVLSQMKLAKQGDIYFPGSSDYMEKAKRAGEVFADSEKIIVLHKCEADKVGVTEKVDFVLAFWMIHEVPDKQKLITELKSIIKPAGIIFIIEPKFHVTKSEFEKMIKILEKTSFEIIGRPKVFISRAVLLSGST